MLRRNSDSRGSSSVAALCAALVLSLPLSVLPPAPSVAQQLSSTSIAPVATDDLEAVFANQPCTVTKALSQLDAPIARMTKRLNAHEAVTIVALGSSSTAGAGASSSAFSYPSRLARELKRRFPLESFTVLNFGANGEEAAQMLVRLDVALTRDPDMIIWQVGTNAVLRDKSIDDVGSSHRASQSKWDGHSIDRPPIRTSRECEVFRPRHGRLYRLGGKTNPRSSFPTLRSDAALA